MFISLKKQQNRELFQENQGTSESTAHRKLKLLLFKGIPCHFDHNKWIVDDVKTHEEYAM